MASKDSIPNPPSTTEPANPAIRDAPIETKPAQAAGETKKPKTEKELKKEREKAEKAAKFAEKKARQEAAKKAAGPSKKEKKKAVEIVEYIEETKPGDKKSRSPTRQHLP
jgi:valyl-tRNA synthetase